MPPSEKDYLALQKELTGYFQLWRDGRRNEWDTDSTHKKEAKKMLFPRPGQWKGHSQDRVSKSVRHRITRPSNLKGPMGKSAMATKAAEQLEEALKVADLRFEKILGWGGLGIACLFEGTNSSGGTFKIVCKANLRKEYGYILARERRSHVSMAGAKHIVARVALQGPAKHNPFPFKAPGHTATTFDGILGNMSNEFGGPAAPTKDAAVDQMEAIKRQLDADENLLFIEFMRRGNLDTYLEKLGAQRLRFPNAILWQIFQCLFKACVAMAYPRKFQPLGSYPENTNLPQVSEAYDGVHRPSSSDPVLVHFDIDTLNILVGEFDEDEHNLVPLIKVADLGLARLVGWEHRNDQWMPWAMRRSGKSNTMSPEQFTEEWDYVPGAPFQRQEVTAGNYHWWTNLYQVGLVMWSLITICRNESPPEARQYTRKADDGTDVVGWTYGEWLLKPCFSGVDLELRELVVRCLDHNPMARPTMGTLYEAFERHAKSKASTTEDQQVQRISRQIFGDPPPPPPAPPSLRDMAAPALSRQPSPGPHRVHAVPLPPPVNMPYAGTAGPLQNPYSDKRLPRPPPLRQPLPGSGPETANPQLRNPNPFASKELPAPPPLVIPPPPPPPTNAPLPPPANAPRQAPANWVPPVPRHVPLPPPRQTPPPPPMQAPPPPPPRQAPPPPAFHAPPPFSTPNPGSGHPPPSQALFSPEEPQMTTSPRRGGGPGPVRKRDQVRRIGDIFRRR